MIDHPGFLYRDRAEYAATIRAYTSKAVNAGDPVLIAVPGRQLGPLTDALGDLASGVLPADLTVAGRNPEWILPGLLLPFLARNPGRRAVIVGEPIWPGRTAAEYPACVIHEALINTVLADRDVSVLCPYDTVGLSPSMVADAWRTHPVMIENGVHRPSTRYADPLTVVASFDRPLPPPPPTAAELEFVSRYKLGEVREFVRRHASGILPESRVDDLVLAANELSTNSLRYTEGGGRISVWTEPGLLVCQVDDNGPFPDLLAGRVPPAPTRTSGRGLILVNQVSDLVRVHRHAAGTTIRLHMSYGGTS